MGGLCSCTQMGIDDQAFKESCGGDLSVVNGPGFACFCCLKNGTTRKAVTLSPTQWARIEDITTGDLRIVEGPLLYFLGPTERTLRVGEALALDPTQYVLVTTNAGEAAGQVRIERGPVRFIPGPYDELSERKDGVNLDRNDYIIVESLVGEHAGELRTIRGPQVFFQGPYERVSAKRTAIPLDENSYVVVEDTETGRLEIQRGPLLYVPGPYDKVGPVKRAISLDVTQYIVVHSLVDGSLRNELGPAMYVPGAYDEVSAVKTAIALAHDEYTRLIDNETGHIRVEVGECKVFPLPTETLLHPERGNKIKAIAIDSETAVLVRNTQDGSLRLVTEEQLFVPSAVEEVEKVQKLVTLADHETVIIVDREGRYTFRSGHREEERAFFIPPYCNLVTLMWSDGPDKEQRTMPVTKIDMRPSFMTYKFTCRTCDNVELVLDVTFFWAVVDCQKMILHTDDAPGDICHHARSMIIEAVSQIDLKRLLLDFNPIVTGCIIESEDPFYNDRGCVIHTVEVRSIHCSNESTEQLLEQYIQETTNRMNRLQKQESENEVRLFKLQGDIEEEKLNGELLKVRHGHHRAESVMVGEAEADRVAAFLSGVAEVIPDPTEALRVFYQLRKMETLEVVSQGESSLYFTPNDVNLSIETFEGPKTQKKLERGNAQPGSGGSGDTRGKHMGAGRHLTVGSGSHLPSRMDEPVV